MDDSHQLGELVLSTDVTPAARAHRAKEQVVGYPSGGWSHTFSQKKQQPSGVQSESPGGKSLAGWRTAVQLSSKSGLRRREELSVVLKLEAG